ncbi:hypothetical protein EV132_12433 [Rhizobium sullae]|uniref:Uncharacterized protein n=1 Tax=Rhizobium sullae TaxID=50338 RepID=A0A4R3PUN4_RHISU|nr:hypothetical protein EV132_12433 [Rhizobium sullae]
MSVFDLISLLLALTAGFAWVNHRYFRLPSRSGSQLNLDATANASYGRRSMVSMIMFTGS